MREETKHIGEIRWNVLEFALPYSASNNLHRSFSAYWLAEDMPISP